MCLADLEGVQMNDKTKIELISKMVDDALEFYADNAAALEALFCGIHNIIHFEEDCAE